MREAMLQAARAAMEAATHSMRCGLPIPPGKTAKDMGYDEQNTNGCGRVGGDLNPYNWGMKNLAFYERPAIIYLKVERNTSASAINLSKSQSITISDSANYYQMQIIPIADVTRIPAGGWLIPVALEPNLDKYVNQSRCDTAGAMSTCVDVQAEKGFWVTDFNAGAQTNLHVGTRYKWTDNPEYSVAPGGKLDSGGLAVDWGGYKGRLDMNLNDFGLMKSPPPCPGFAFKMCGSPGRPCGTVNNWH
jgi:hypothetical protein